MLNMSFELLSQMDKDNWFHVYDRRTRECIYHCLTTDQLEIKIVENQVRFSDHEIIKVTNDDCTNIDTSQ